MTEEIDRIDVKRTVDFIAKSIRDGCQRFVGERSSVVTRDGITDFVQRLLTMLDGQDRIAFEVKEDEAGQFIVSLRGPEDMIRGLVPGRMAVATGVRNPLYVVVTGTRTWLGVGKDISNEVKCVITIEDRDDAKVLRVTDGGVTGHESFVVTDEIIHTTCTEGWSACAGTKGRWDSLFIPAEEMRTVFDVFGLLPRSHG